MNIEEISTVDESEVRLQQMGMPFDIDRMCILLTDSAAIRDVLLFPTMKTLDK